MSKRMPEHDRRNLELLYQTNIQVILMWIGAAVIADVSGFFAGFQFEGTARTIVGFLGFLIGMFLLAPAVMTGIKTRKIMKALGMETTIAKYLVQKKNSKK